MPHLAMWMIMDDIFDLESGLNKYPDFVEVKTCVGVGT
jgi:hypothetical protein